MKKILSTIILAICFSLMIPGYVSRAYETEFEKKNTKEGMDIFFKGNSNRTLSYADVEISVKDNVNGEVRKSWTVRVGETFSVSYAEFNNIYSNYTLYAQFYNDRGEKSGNITWTMGCAEACIYDLNGGQSFSSEMTVRITPGVNYIEFPMEKPLWEGHTFLGWNTKKDGTGTMYQPKDKFTFSKPRETVYAQWEDTVYTIEYKANRGDWVPPIQQKKYGQQTTISSVTPSREDYTFIGWNTKYDGTGTSYKANQVYKENADLVLYAMWAPSTYKVTFNGNGLADMTKKYNIDLTLPTTVPKADGYTFIGWKVSGKDIVYQPGDVYKENANLNLYAQWKLNVYLVDYDANEGMGAPLVQFKNHNEYVEISRVKPVRTGYEFVCWNTKKDGTGTDYKAGDRYSINSDVKLYAKWKANTYAIKYDSNGGEGAVGNQNKVYGTNLTLTTKVPTKLYYSFAGWNTKKDGTGTMYQPGGIYKQNEGCTLYAQWKYKYSTSPFADVAKDNWAFESVKYVYERSIMSGKGVNSSKKVIFAPTDNITRAETAMVIYNMAKKPTVKYQSIFSDVKAGQWYSEAVTWAYQNKIAAGYGKTFGVNDKITREQMAVMLYSYAKFQKYSITTNSKALDNFPDRNKISSWAREAMVWAVSNGIMKGDGKNLKPGSNASRAEAAAMIANFMERFVK